MPSKGQIDLLKITGFAALLALLLAVMLGSPAHANTSTSTGGVQAPSADGSEAPAETAPESSGGIDIALERRMQRDQRRVRSSLRRSLNNDRSRCRRVSTASARSRCRSRALRRYRSRLRSANRRYAERRVQAGLPRREPLIDRARLRSDGKAQAPINAPDEVKAAIAAANRITDKPYRYGGGHARWNDSGYDCSGAVSFALRGGGFVSSPMNSSGYMSWGERGRGDWVTVYTHSGHAYVVIAGLRFDTSRVNDRGGERGPRWRSGQRSSSGFRARHPKGF